MPPCTRKRWFVAVGAATGALGAQANAIEWRSSPVVSVEVGGDSNIRLTPVDPRYASRGAVIASAQIVARDPGFEFRVAPQIRALRYVNKAEVDRNDAFTRFDLTLNDQQQRWSLGGNYSRESTLTSEFETSGILIDQERVLRSLDTGWNRVMSPRGTFGLSAAVTSVGYENVAGSGSPFVNYDYRMVQAGYSLNTSARSVWNFSVVHSVLSGVANEVSPSNTQLSVAWTHAFSEKLRGTFGVSAFDIGPVVPGLDKGASTAARFSVTRDWRRWSLESNGNREVRPEGRGLLTREDAVTLDARRRFGDRLSVGVTLRRARVEATGFFAVFYDRDYSSAGVNVNWQAAQRWALNGSLLARAQEYVFVPRADGLASTLSFSYRGK